MPITFNTLPVLPAPNTANFIVGQRLLLIDIIPGISSSVAGIVQVVSNPLSAYNLFGPSRLVQSMGEVAAQTNSQVMAVALNSQSDIPALFESLSGVGIDVCVPLGIPANYSNFATFGNIGYTRELEGTPILFCMEADLSKGSTLANLTSYLPAVSAGSYTNASMQAPIQFSRYVVQSPDIVTVNPDTPIQYTANAAASIAGLLISRPPYKSITNRAIKNIRLDNPYKSSDCAALAQNGYVTLRNSAARGVVINYGVTSTSSNPNSPIFTNGFHNIASFRTCQYVVQAIQQQTQNFIGNTPSTILLNDAIANTLAQLKKSKIFLNAWFTLNINQVAGYILLNLSLALETEITTVNVVAQLSYIRG